VPTAPEGRQSGCYTALTPDTGATIRRLAALAPRTLAVMHGSSYSGETAPLLEALASFYDDRLRERAASGHS
jgi:hypothetical protein